MIRVVTNPTLFLEDNEEPDLELLDEMLAGDNPSLILLHYNLAGDWDAFHKSLIMLGKDDRLLVLQYSRGAFSSENDWTRVHSIFKKENTMKQIKNHLKERWVITNSWASPYTESEFRMHKDCIYRF